MRTALLAAVVSMSFGGSAAAQDLSKEAEMFKRVCSSLLATDSYSQAAKVAQKYGYRSKVKTSFGYGGVKGKFRLLEHSSSPSQFWLGHEAGKTKPCILLFPIVSDTKTVRAANKLHEKEGREIYKSLLASGLQDENSPKRRLTVRGFSYYVKYQNAAANGKKPAGFFLTSF